MSAQVDSDDSDGSDKTMTFS
eukprot:SAG11_NODE_50367_length_114_cov_58.800000_1_plen_20_part_01